MSIKDDFFKALHARDVSTIQTLLRERKDLVRAVNTAERLDRRYPLAWASAEGYEAVVDVLLENGAKVNAIYYGCRTPLCMAVENDHIEVVRRLLHHGAKVNAFAGMALFLAVDGGNFEIVQLLLEYGADANLKCSLSDSTTLMRAVERKLPRIVCLLLRHKSYDETLSWALENNHTVLVEEIVETRMTTASKAALHHSPERYPSPRRSVLDGLQPHSSNTQEDRLKQIFFNSMYQKNLKKMMQLLRRHPELLRTTDTSRSLERRFPLSWACSEGELDIVQILLEYGAKPNGVKYGHRTPLCLAVEKNHVAVAETLLQYGAKVDIFGGAPLFLAVERDNTEMIRLLLKYNADVSLTYHLSDVATVALAIRNGQISTVQLLLGHKSFDETFAWAISNSYDSFIRILLKNGIISSGNMSLRLKNGSTPLLWAISEHHSDIVERLLELGANPNKCDLNGETPLLAAIELYHQATVELLIRKGANVNACNPQSQETPLLRAIRSTSAAMVEVLIKHGAEVNSDVSGDVPLVWAIEKNDPDMVRLLLDHGAQVNKGTANATPLARAIQKTNKDILEMVMSALWAKAVSLGYDFSDLDERSYPSCWDDIDSRSLSDESSRTDLSPLEPDVEHYKAVINSILEKIA